MSNPINVNPSIANLGLRELAKFGSSIYGNDIYYLKNFIDLMIPVIGEKEIVERLLKNETNNKERLVQIGTNWEQTKIKLKKLDKLIERTKASFDSLEDKTLKKKELVSYKNLLTKASKITPLKSLIFDLMVFLIEDTTIGRMTIPSEYFKILEHKGHRPVGEMDKRLLGGRMEYGQR